MRKKTSSYSKVFAVIGVSAMIVAACMGNMKLKEFTNNKPIEQHLIDEATGKNDLEKKFAIEAMKYQEEIDNLKGDLEAIRKAENIKFDITRANRLKDEKIIKAISNNLKGVFTGKSEYIFFCAKAYNVNPMLLAAIFYHESGNGSSYAVTKLNNPGGIMGNKGLVSFRTLDEGIDSTAKLIKNNYIDCGLTTLQQIQRKYCPVGAKNDPTNLNRFWLPMVSMKYQKILEEAQV
jgi:beta-N-acetylglucosaminidase